MSPLQSSCLRCFRSLILLGLGGLLTLNMSLAHAAVNVNQLVNDSAPAIVQVQGIQWVKVKIPEKYKNITDDPVYQSLSSIFVDNPNLGKQAAPVVKKRIVGTGFIIGSNGRIATNYQWIKGANEVVVILADKRQFKAQVVRSDPKNDLSTLKIAANNLPALGLARQVEEGEGVIAIGANRKGVSVGVVVSTPAQTPAIGLVSDVDISRDNSGGPLLNIYGQVLGINSTKTRAPLGLSRHPSLGKLSSDGYDQKAHAINMMSQVGFSARNMDEAQNLALGMNTAAGAIVIQVRAGSMAANAGLQKNDVIIGLETQNISDASDLSALPDFLRQDNRANLRIFRNGETLELTLVNPKAQSPSVPWSWQRLGLRVRPLSPSQKDLADVKSGVQITEVQGSATAAGLQAGDWIISVNKTPLNTMGQLNQMAQALSPEDAVVIYVIRGDVRQFITLTATE